MFPSNFKCLGVCRIYLSSIFKLLMNMVGMFAKTYILVLLVLVHVVMVITQPKAKLWSMPKRTAYYIKNIC